MSFYDNGANWVSDAFPECKFTQAVSWYCYEHDDGCPGAKFIAAEIRRLCPVDALVAAGMTIGCSHSCFNDGLLCLSDDTAIVSFGYNVDGSLDYYYNHDYVADYDELMRCLPAIYARFIELYSRVR